MSHQRFLLATLCCASALGVVHRAQAAASDATGTPVGEVVITAPRQEVTARVVQMTAPNMVSVRAIETIKKYPDFNAAEALSRMPGISLSSDTGEGRFVQIRGIDANLDGATYGGVPLLNTFPGGTESGGGGRAVEFDTIPTGAIDGIIVTYTLLPDHEAEGLGGSIELTPRTAANITKPFGEADIGWGDELLRPRTGPFNAEIAFGARFGFGDHGLEIQNGPVGTPRSGFFSNPTPFSFVFSASRKDDRRAIDDLEESYIDDGVAQSNAVSRYDLRRYDSYHRRRFAYGGEFDFQPNDDHRWYARADLAGYTESVHKNFLLFTGLDAAEVTGSGGACFECGVPVDPNNPNGYLVTTSPEITLTDEEEVHRNTIYTIGGVDRWGDVTLDYHAAYSRATFHARRNIGAQFQGPVIPFTYDNVSRPNFPIFGLPDGTNLDDPNLYTLSGIDNSQEYDIDEEYSYAANLTFPVHLFNDSDRIKIGAEARLRDKTSTEIDESFDVPPLSLAGLSGPAVSYYNNLYTNGPQINLYAIRNLINTGVAVSSGPQFNPGSYINDQENIYVGYAQYTTTIGNWGFLAGVRVEATDADYGGFIQTSNLDGSTTNTLQFRPDSYVNAFPTVQVRYNVTPRVVIRATYSTGIGRPGFTQTPPPPRSTAHQAPWLSHAAIRTCGRPPGRISISPSRTICPTAELSPSRCSTRSSATTSSRASRTASPPIRWPGASWPMSPPSSTSPAPTPAASKPTIIRSSSFCPNPWTGSVSRPTSPGSTHGFWNTTRPHRPPGKTSTACFPAPRSSPGTWPASTRPMGFRSAWRRNTSVIVCSAWAATRAWTPSRTTVSPWTSAPATS